jgi:hypothetical protein
MRELYEEFKRGRDLSRTEIYEIFEYTEQLERDADPLDFQMLLEMGGWVRSISGARRRVR